MFRILVPLDGSALAESALDMACWTARATAGQLDLLLVHATAPLDGSEAMAHVAARQAEAMYLDRVAKRIAAEWAIPAAAHVTDGGAVRVICERARELGTDLIVMTTHGRTGMSRFWIGSVADGVMRGSSVPVLLMRGSDDKPARTASPLARVLIPLDGSPLAEQALGPALELATAARARVTLLQVVRPVPMVTMDVVIPYTMALPVIDEEETNGLVADAQAYLARRAAAIPAGVTVETRVVIDEHPATAILEVADDLKVNLIAMTTHGRGVSRLLVGSVADKVLRATPAPLLLYRPKTRELATARETSPAAAAAR